MKNVKEVVHDRRGHAIYLTEERWKHIIETHKQMTPYRDHVLKAIRIGLRRQDPLDPGKYKYSRAFDDLRADFTHVVVVVKFETRTKSPTREEENNFVLTAYLVSRMRG